MKKNLIIVFFTVAFFSCSTADKKVPQVANDFCNCFQKMEKEFDPKTKSIIAQAADAEDPTAALQKSVTDLTPEEQERVGAEMVSLGDLEDENSEIGTCIKNVEKKYDNEYTLNKDKYADKIVKELESKPGCNFTASLLKLGLKMEKQNKKK